jgi:hypothetical protein
MRSIGALAVAAAAAVGAGVLVAPPAETEYAAFSTNLAGRTASQRHNVALCVARLDGAIVAPDEIFSFNSVVGSWSRDQGYKKAPVSYNGQLVDSWGGGVCQVSTTLYNAALLAGMTIVERHPHRFAPSYIAPGRDAAVAFSNIDLRLLNPYPHPLRVVASIDGDRLTMRLVGRGRPGALPEIREEIRQWRAHRTYIEPGPARVRNGGKNGYEVAVWRVWNDRRELISTDDYPAMHRILQRQEER